MFDKFDKIVDMIVEAKTVDDTAKIENEIQNARQWLDITILQVEQLTKLNEKIKSLLN